MSDRRCEAKRRRLAEARKALAALSDELETLQAELAFFTCDVTVLLEHPAVAPVPDLCAEIDTLGTRVGTCDERVYELQQKIADAIAAADTALAEPASAPDLLN